MASYLGSPDSFDRAVAAFAEAHSRQTERGHASSYRCCLTTNRSRRTRPRANMATLQLVPGELLGSKGAPQAPAPVEPNDDQSLRT